MNKSVKAVRIMCDWATDPIWPTPSIPNSTVEGCRVSPALWSRIIRWQRWYETHDPFLGGGCVGDDPNYDLGGFSVERYEIARAVKAELPEWIVLYNDELLDAWTLSLPGRKWIAPVEILISPH
jgi:hypothetical protein